MKWFIFFPVWVFLLSYVIHRVREADREEAVSETSALDGGAVAEQRPPAPGLGGVRGATMGGSEMRQLVEVFATRVQLVPVAEDAAQQSPLWPMDGLGDAAKAVAVGADFDTWELHQGEGFSFYFPQGVGLSVETVPAGFGFPKLGEIFYQGFADSAVWYRIVGPGGMTWAAFAVDAEAGFDSRARYPDGEVFHKVLLADGGVARVSLAPDGKLGRVQWLGGGKRVSLLGWQHCAVHPDAYVALAASLRLGAGGESGGREAIMRRLAGEGGIESRMGLLERGMDSGQIEELLGRPSGTEGGVLIYDGRRRERAKRYRLELGSGGFDGFRDGWRTLRKDPPIPGEVDWMLEKTEIRAGLPGGGDYDLGALTDDEVKMIFTQIQMRLPKADASEWDDLCQVLANLSELRLRDPATLDLVRQRFLEKELPAAAAIVVLRSWDPEAARDLFVSKATDMLAGERPAAADLRLMLAYLGKGHRNSLGLVTTAAGHRSPEVRSVAYTFWDWFDEAVRRPLLARGLQDSAASVRRRSAEAFAAEAGSVEDLPLLQNSLDAESDNEVREHLQRAIDGLGG